jgi:hypothetical protein
MAREEFYATRPFEYNGRDLDRGQILGELDGCRNDEKLVRLGYVAKVPNGTFSECGKCGARFIDQPLRNGHVKRRHARHRPVDPRLEDIEFEREERKLQQVAPLNLDKTTATMEMGGPMPVEIAPPSSDPPAPAPEPEPEPKTVDLHPVAAYAGLSDAEWKSIPPGRRGVLSRLKNSGKSPAEVRARFDAWAETEV